MTVIFIRTVIVYLLLLLSMRLMGKRQIGELEVTDLVITLLLSDIATNPIADPDIPLVYVVIPILTLLAMEVTLSLLFSRFPKLKNLGSARPSVLIRHGVIDTRELNSLRISAEELISELRQKEITEIDEVEYAILEQNGKISVIPRAAERQPTRKDMNITVEESGISHIIISRGTLNRYNLQHLGLNDEWLEKQLKQNHCHMDEVFLMTVNDQGKLWLQKETNGSGGGGR